MLSKNQREELRKLTEAATEGPWHPVCGLYLSSDMRDIEFENGVVAECLYSWDADFIARARTAIPELLASLDEAEKEIAELKAKVDRLQQSAWDAKRKYHTCKD